jgi:hypothetical protein
MLLPLSIITSNLSTFSVRLESLTRIFSTAIGQSLESWVGATFKPLAYALILLREEGYPYVSLSLKPFLS